MSDGYKRNKGAIRMVALFDTVLALFLFAFYLVGGVILNTMIFSVQNGPFSRISLAIISTLMWGVVIGITYLQLVAAYKLFLVTFQEVLGPQAAAQRALAYLRTSAVVLGFVLFKIIFCYLRYPNLIWFMWILCVMEIVFRLLAVYFVREFCDDMKHHIRLEIHPPPVVKSEEISVPEVVISNHIESIETV